MTNFNWRQYVTISPDFPPEQRALLEQSLNDIARFQDNEGQELLRAAFERHGGHPIQISPGEVTQTGSGIVTVNMSQEAAAVIYTPDGPVHPGLTSTLVHELYHCADDQSDVDAQSIQTFAHMLNMSPDDPRLRQAVELLHASSRGSQRVGEVIAFSLTVDRADAVALLRGRGYADIADRLSAVDTNAAVNALRADGVISVDQTDRQINLVGPIMRYEEDAVDYTDALLEKNYGPVAPKRNTYLNMSSVVTSRESPALPSVPKLSGIRYETHGFSADPYHVPGMDDVPAPPQVRATDGREAPIPTRDGYQR